MNTHILTLTTSAAGRYSASCSCGAWKATSSPSEDAIYRSFDIHVLTSR